MRYRNIIQSYALQRLLAALMTASLVACGSEDTGSGSSNDSTQGGSAGSGHGSPEAGTAGSLNDDAGHGGEQPTDSGNSNGLTASISGTALDGQGAALTGGRVQLCHVACRTADIGSDGSYEFPAVEPGTHLLELFPAESSGVWLVPSSPIELLDHQHRDIDLTWLAPSTTTDVPATASSIPIAEGIHITIGLDTATPSLYLTDTFSKVYGTKYPVDNLPVTESAPATPIAMWVLGPLDTESKGDGFPVSFDNDASLPDGTQCHVWLAEQDTQSLDGRWFDVGTVIAQGNQLSGDAKLPKLGTVLLTK